ncbi:MFS transporter [Oryzicola mucosus]|uniref:MFS transporter n=1 Tax=Oryzicola mucosus TaxID=2767425 RepID=A0A8J6PQY8_9HYPH|nr:MFS transporter [Oryzicola mucosus]MBD0416580.1 MFS transporter [Oryzicola mucosus]
MSLAAEAEVRRTALILASAQAVIGSAVPIVLSMGALAGQYLLGADKSLATLPVTSFNLGVALGAIPAAAIVRALGLRQGFQFGTILTAAGGGITTLALFRGEFWLFVIGAMLVGIGGSFVQQFRFAAADNAPPQFKAKAISLVLAGGIVTAILGPQIVIFTRDLLEPTLFAGAFVAIIGLAVVGAVILSFLRVHEPLPPASRVSAPKTSLWTVVRRPKFAAALICGVCTYMLMSFVMTGAPLAMVGCGFSVDQATLGISWHVMAMFGPSFFTGRIIQRFGAERVVAVGVLLLIVCALVALSGIQLWQFWTSLILLGLGWNFGFIGATAIVASSYRPEEKAKAQGFHDFVLFGSVAFASLMSGIVYNAYGWEMLNWIVFPVCAICLAALAWLFAIKRSGAAELSAH